MANTTTSTNMLLTIPVVGVDPGPQYATDVNNCLTIIDGHDHSSGNGVQVTPAGLDINADLAIGSNNLTLARSVRFVSQPAPISGGADIGAVYVSGVDLYYNDGSGTQIQVTKNGFVNAGSGSITGLVSPASASYVSANSTFVWESDTNIAANMDAGSYIFRNLTANSMGVTLNPPATISLDYALFLPQLPAANNSFVTIDTDGTMSSNITVDNSTIVISSNQLVAQPQNFSNTEREHAWELNGAYASLAYPLTNIDSIFIAPYNLIVTSVWIYNGTVGSGGQTEFDLKWSPPGGSFASMLSTTGIVSSASHSVIWTDSGTIIGSQTGVRKPVISRSAFAAGQAIRFDLISSMSGAPTDARIRIFYKQQ